VKVVLDTSVVIASDAPSLDGELAVSAVTLAELHFGVLVAADAGARAERLRRFTLVERLFDPLPVDEAVAREYGVLAAAVVHAGRQPRARVMDLLIAATAKAHGARIYTRNPSDLQGLEELVDVVPV
jgi:toxin FitB